MYCKDCEESCCTLCAVTTHKLHNTLTLTQASEEVGSEEVGCKLCWHITGLKLESLVVIPRKQLIYADYYIQTGKSF